MPTDKSPRNAEGEQHGYCESYYSNGQLCYKGEFVNGLPNGFIETYYTDGSLVGKGVFDMGKRVGFWLENPNMEQEGIIYKTFYAD